MKYTIFIDNDKYLNDEFSVKKIDFKKIGMDPSRAYVVLNDSTYSYISIPVNKPIDNIDKK
jgi:hypothetical protein